MVAEPLAMFSGMKLNIIRIVIAYRRLPKFYKRLHSNTQEVIKHAINIVPGVLFLTVYVLVNRHIIIKQSMESDSLKSGVVNRLFSLDPITPDDREPT